MKTSLYAEFFMKTKRPLIVLSGGALPTEEIYFLKSSAPLFLKDNVFLPIRINCKNPLILPSTLISRKYSCAHLIIMRSIPENWLIFIENNRQFFSTITYLIDDDLSAACIENPADYLPDDYVVKLEKIFLLQDRFFNLADTVVTSCKFLQSKFFSKHVDVRLLPPSYIYESPTYDHFNSISNQIIYSGTRSHLVDLNFIIPSLLDVGKKYPTESGLKMSFFLGNHLPEPLKGQSFIKNYHSFSWNNYFRYQSLNRFNIGLAPLVDTPFNSGKSWNKFHDITAFGAVGIYSDRSPYRDIVIDGINGLLAKDDMLSWKECLLRLLDHPIDTLGMAKSALKTAKDIGNISENYLFWRELYG